MLKLLVELVPPTSANSWQLFGEELNWHQFVSVMTEPFSMWSRRENHGIIEYEDRRDHKDHVLLEIWPELCSIGCFAWFGFSWKLESMFLQRFSSLQLTEQLYCFYFCEGKVFVFDFIWFFKARNKENY